MYEACLLLDHHGHQNHDVIGLQLPSCAKPSGPTIAQASVILPAILEDDAYPVCAPHGNPQDRIAQGCMG